jgi:penicillin-binding protein 1C
MLPNALIPDIPTRFQGFRPENSDFSYSGAVPAGDALARSLNIPAVRMLQMLDEERFLSLLHRMGFTTFARPASHYGLSLILGGGEASLWELAGAYASMARVLKNSLEGNDAPDDWHMPVVIQSSVFSRQSAVFSHQSSVISRQPSVFSQQFEAPTQQEEAQSRQTVPGQQSPAGAGQSHNPPLTPPAIWLTYEALRRVNRPETETGWQYFGSSPEVAWKTGTSFGYRDAWAIGTTPDYVVAVWTGNADGEGRPGLSGITSSAPLLFDIIRLLQPSTSHWFARPGEGMTLTEVCAASGYRAGPLCEEKRQEWIPEAGLRSEACPYHLSVALDASEKYRVSTACYSPSEMVIRPWFVLPPAMEYYYRMRNPSYHTLPPFLKGCADDTRVPSMEFIYPPRDARIFIPRSLGGEMMSILPEIAHRRKNAAIYWHLDDSYIGMTRHIHQTELRAGQGEHIITAVDDEGMTITRRFYCIGTL